MFRTKTDILQGLDPHNPISIQALIDFHRSTFGGYVMKDEGAGADAGATPTGQGDPKGKDEAGKDAGGKDEKDAGGGDGDDKPLGANGEKALQTERDARKALETELKQFKTGLAEALGIETKDAKSTDLVSELQKQVQEMRHDTLVDRVARDAKISDADDLELLKTAPDEATMRKLATRLAKESDEAAGNRPGTPGTRRPPRQDPSQGRGTGGAGPSGKDAGLAEARRRFPATQQ